ncbi:LytTR family DNA-binding domain-containing protein [uncultured Alistipes sp.]|jgi:two-component system response regulator LytT|uniref:LytR/AlgR family response regulator transcription factor n=1 Tax=uncultured Alistipes sp. TaxID=538949 RepID=UPI000E9FF3DC|nr:LytTR family DNA-binding domain-containing protein [uncultured Alistipes sp.]HBL70810.1 DNA-binding response regulator [Alistipes sp.]HBW00958.1 DNA-binding response regulator [Alistipes sp.]
MKTIRCIAIDDEPMALLVIEQFCRRKGGLSLETFSEPHVGLETIRRTRPELVFLDIRMNGMDGLEVAQALPKGCCLIFTTAYAQYALDGFDLDAVDFLHKPFAYERFVRAVDKALRRIEARAKSDRTETVTLKQEYNNVVIPVNEILYLEAMENYTKVHRRNGRYILSRNSLKRTAELLPADQFLRVHKSYVVALSQVAEYSHVQLRLKESSVIIPIGRTYVDVFLQRIRKNDEVPAEAPSSGKVN